MRGKSSLDLFPAKLLYWSIAIATHCLCQQTISDIVSTPNMVSSTARERALARVAAREQAAAKSSTNEVRALPPIPENHQDSVSLVRLDRINSATPDSAETSSTDLLPLTISIRLRDDVCEPLLPRTTPLPARAKKVLTTTVSDQRSARIELYLGERLFARRRSPAGGSPPEESERGAAGGNNGAAARSAKNNLLLGEFVVAPLPERSHRGFVQVELEVEAQRDENGQIAIVARGIDIEGRLLAAAEAKVVDVVDHGDESHSSPGREGEGKEPSYATGEWKGVLRAAGAESDHAPRFETKTAEGAADIFNESAADEIALFSHALAKTLPTLLATRVVRLFNGTDVLIRQHTRRAEAGVGTGGILWESAIVLADYFGRHNTRHDSDEPNSLEAPQFSWRGKRVLELGIGTGLVSIALAFEGAHVVATDLSQKVLDGARENARLALGHATKIANLSSAGEDRQGSIDFVLFDWSSSQDLARMRSLGPWDAIVGSDLVYPGNLRKLNDTPDGEQERSSASFSESESLSDHAASANPGADAPADRLLLSVFENLAAPSTEVVLALKDRTGEVERFERTMDNVAWRCERVAREYTMPDFQQHAKMHVLHLYRK